MVYSVRSTGLAHSHLPIMYKLLCCRESEDDITVSGVPILSKQSFLYTGRHLDFIWEEAGISLHFPATYGVETAEITVEVMPDIDEHSIFPPKYRLMPAASATYKITANSTIPAPVRIRIDHCAVLQNEDELILMVAHGGPLYYFQPLPKAQFPLTSSYGEIEVKGFSIFRSLWNLVSYYRMHLAIQVFYKKDSTATFVVTKNLKAHIGAVKDTIEHIRYEDTLMVLESTTDAITLSMPAELEGSWHVTPTFEPAKIKTIQIIAYEPGQSCPKIILRMRWGGSGNPEEKIVNIPIHGGSIKTFALLCTPIEMPLEPEVTAKQNCTQPCNGKIQF